MAKVKLECGKSVKMSELKIGDQVQTGLGGDWLSIIFNACYLLMLNRNYSRFSQIVGDENMNYEELHLICSSTVTHK